MNLWNANCDAKLPKTKGELLRDLDVWERSQGGGAAQPGVLTGPNAVMAKNFDAAAWSTNHDNDFKRLIENARKKKGNKNEDIQPSQSSEPGTNVSMNSQQDASMPLRSIDGENPVSTAEQSYSFTETSTQVNMSGNAERLGQSLPSFMSKPEIMRPAEGDPGS
jgi:E3 ubiquitin-protein ligase RAD18